MRLSKPALTGCALAGALAVLAVLAGCGGSSIAGSTAATTPPGIEVATQPATTTTPSAQSATFGMEHRFASGLVVTVSEPEPFRPSANAYPPSPHAASFLIVLRNDGDKAYEPSHLSITATVGQRQTKQVVDATQGYTGVPNADRDLPPRGVVRMNLAFAMPDTAEPLRLVLRAEPDGPAAVYSGSVQPTPSG